MCVELTEVDKVHERVYPGEDEDELADELVEVDVVVEGQELRQPQVPQLRDAVPQHQHQRHHRVEVQHSS